MREAGNIDVALGIMGRRTKLLSMRAGAFLVVCIASGSMALASGAVYRFNEGTGTTAVDSSGAGNDGTIDGAYFVPGPFGSALRFADASHRVLLPESLFSGYLNTFYSAIRSRRRCEPSSRSSTRRSTRPWVPARWRMDGHPWKSRPQEPKCTRTPC